MLKRLFLEQQQVICAMLLEDGDKCSLMPFTGTDGITTIEELVEILKYLYQAIEILSGKLYPAISMMLPNKTVFNGIAYFRQ